MSTAQRINKHPIIFEKPKTWFKIIHPAIAAKTHSSEYIIAAGASSICF